MQVDNLEFNAQVRGEGETFVWGHGLSASIEAEEVHRLLPKSELFIAQGYEDFKIIPERIWDFVTEYA